MQDVGGDVGGDVEKEERVAGAVPCPMLEEALVKDVRCDEWL